MVFRRYGQNNEICQQAVSELDTHILTGPLRSNHYSPWLEKWEDLRQQFDLPPLFGTEQLFFDYHWTLTEHKKYLSYSAEAIQAYERFMTIDEEDEMALLNWLVQHEVMHNELTLFVYSSMCAELDEKKTVIKMTHFDLDASEFLPLTKFCNVYWDNYYPKLEEYDTFIELEKAEKGNDEEFSDNMLSLTYHLRKRNLIE